MIFSSYEFLFAFLPVTYAFFFLANRIFGLRAGLVVLTLASLIYYQWWNAGDLVVLVGAIVMNYLLGGILARTASKPFLIFGIVTNLGLIGIFKYNVFIADNLYRVFGATFETESVALPLGISFFTFQQIAYLVDCYRYRESEGSVLNYFLFVSFFPQLIAGPIVHHREMLPQFFKSENIRPLYQNLAVGLFILIIGVFKKAFVADHIEIFVSEIYDAASRGRELTLLEAWGGTLAYSFQIYFDFSGYSDMAIGLGRMFGIKLPTNFESPYKSPNITDFWRRWHMTLSRFLRDYLYFPLGGNRRGAFRQGINLMIVMFLGGLWHGAGWNFALWGIVHGVFLVLHRGWSILGGERGVFFFMSDTLRAWCARGLTFVAVTVAWVPFRASSTEVTENVLRGMAGLNGVSMPIWLSPLYNAVCIEEACGGVLFSQEMLFHQPTRYLWMLALLGAVWFLPNAREIGAKFECALEGLSVERMPFVRIALWSSFCAGIFILALTALPKQKEFIYFVF